MPISRCESLFGGGDSIGDRRLRVFIGADGRTRGAEGIYGVKTVPPTFPFGNIHMEMDSGAPNTRSQSKDGNIFL